MSEFPPQVAELLRDRDALGGNLENSSGDGNGVHDGAAVARSRI